MNFIFKNLFTYVPCVFVYNIIFTSNTYFNKWFYNNESTTKKITCDRSFSIQKNNSNNSKDNLHQYAMDYENENTLQTIFENEIENVDENDENSSPNIVINQPTKRLHTFPLLPCKYCNRPIYDDNVLYRYSDHNFCSKFCVKQMQYKFYEF